MTPPRVSYRDLQDAPRVLERRLEARARPLRAAPTGSSVRSPERWGHMLPASPAVRKWVPRVGLIALGVSLSSLSSQPRTGAQLLAPDCAQSTQLGAAGHGGGPRHPPAPAEPQDPVPLTTYTAFEESAVQGEGLWQEGLRPGSPSVQMRTGRSRGRVGRWGSGTPNTPALTSVGSFSSKFQLLACKMGAPSHGVSVDAGRRGRAPHPHLLPLYSGPSFAGPLHPVLVVLAALMAVRLAHGDGQGGESQTRWPSGITWGVFPKSPTPRTCPKLCLGDQTRGLGACTYCTLSR